MPDPCVVWYSYSHSDFNAQEDIMSEQRRTGIILGEYKGLQVPGFDRTITDEDVMESLRACRHRASRWISISRSPESSTCNNLVFGRIPIAG